MKRKNSINQPNATSVTFLLIMQGFWAHTYYDVLKTLQDSKTALISQFWSVMVLSVGSLMPSVMQSHMGFIVTSFTWYVMGQVMQSIEGLKTSWLWLSNTYFMETLTISIYPPPQPHLSPRPTPLPPSPQQTLKNNFKANVSSEFQIEWMICHTIHMGATSLQYEWANECWCFQSVRMPFCILCSCVDSLHCDRVCAYSNSQPLCMTLHAGHTCTRVRLLLNVNE